MQIGGPDSDAPAWRARACSVWTASRVELQQWLGLANYFREFLPDFADKAAPLYELTSPLVPFSLSYDHMHAFRQTKDAVLSHNVDPTKPLVLYTDASLIALGAILYQEGRPVQITSRSFTMAERNYNTTEKELLPINHAANKWRHLFESTNLPITVLTDHKAINRWIEILQPFKVVFEHVAGISNPADFPSRRPDYRYTLGGMEGGGEP